MDRKFWIIGTLILIAAAGIVAYFIYDSNQIRGTVFNPPQQAPNIVLTDQHNQTYQLSDQKGKIVLLYFGFTNCPEECPLTMAKLKQVTAKLGSDANRVQVVMITTDPARDTPAVLGSYMNKFDPNFIGLSGNVNDLQKVWDSYSVVVEDGGETHSAFIYLINQQGYMQALYDLNAQVDDITHDLKVFLRKG